MRDVKSRLRKYRSSGFTPRPLAEQSTKHKTHARYKIAITQNIVAAGLPRDH